jgi:hypothetical protein
VVEYINANNPKIEKEGMVKEIKSWIDILYVSFYENKINVIKLNKYKLKSHDEINE